MWFGENPDVQWGTPTVWHRVRSGASLRPKLFRKGDGFSEGSPEARGRGWSPPGGERAAPAPRPPASRALLAPAAAWASLSLLSPGTSAPHRVLRHQVPRPLLPSPSQCHCPGSARSDQAQDAPPSACPLPWPQVPLSPDAGYPGLLSRPARKADASSWVSLGTALSMSCGTDCHPHPGLSQATCGKSSASSGGPWPSSWDVGQGEEVHSLAWVAPRHLWIDGSGRPGLSWPPAAGHRVRQELSPRPGEGLR